MRRGLVSYVAIVLAACAPLLAPIVPAEVYRWTDEEGNVHFGDKPKDPELMEQVNKVDIIESYQPTQRTPQEQSAYKRQQDALRRSRQVYAEEDRSAREEARAKQREMRAVRCGELKADIAKLSELHLESGVRTYYYLADEEGQSVTSQQQKAYVAELKEEYAKTGCR